MLTVLVSEERGDSEGSALELAVWRRIVKHALGERASEAIERAVASELTGKM